jgi:hypothetical protein
VWSKFCLFSATSTNSLPAVVRASNTGQDRASY